MKIARCTFGAEHAFKRTIVSVDRAGNFVYTPTINYVSTVAYHYAVFGEIPPDDSKVIVKLADNQHPQVVSYAQYKAVVDAEGCR